MGHGARLRHSPPAWKTRTEHPVPRVDFEAQAARVGI
jgi:hypothetical protein